MPPSVTVIVRTKNRPEFLRRALSDIANQSFVDLDIVVVNDGGERDAVNDIVSASEDERIRVYDTTGVGGRCAAANLGLRESMSEYVVLHDDDDLWHRDFLRRTVAVLDSSPEDAGVAVATEIVYEERTSDGWTELSRRPYWAGLTSMTLTGLLDVNRMVPISFLYRRAIHDLVGYYDESLETVEDWEFYLRLAQMRPLAILGGTPLAYWMQRPSSSGDDANSMFALGSAHVRDDLAVRDRALKEWVADNGIGLPLYIGLVERRLREQIERNHAEMLRELERRGQWAVEEIYRRHPVWRRMSRLRRRRTH